MFAILVEEHWEFHSDITSAGTTTKWTRSDSSFQHSFVDRRLSDMEVCEIMLCGMDGTADGHLRGAEYGTARCNCDAITSCC